MANLKIVDGAQLDADLSTVAAAIRNKAGNQMQLAFPDGFVAAINAMELSSPDATPDLLKLFLSNQLVEYQTDLGGEAVGYAFRNCSKLEAVTFDNLATPGAYMFQSCSKLKKASFPNAVIISTGTFHSCRALVEAYFPKSLEIGPYAFYNCAALPQFDGAGALSVGGNAFYGCTTLQTLILRSHTFVELANVNAFTNSPMETGAGYIYVPSTLVNVYKAANNWSTYANQFRAIEDYPEITGGGA